MSQSSITAQIKNFVLSQCGMDKVGIAPVSRFNESPEGFHPTDFLPGCKSIIVFCIRLPDGAVQATYRTFEDKLRHCHGIYGTYGYTIAPNFHLMFGNYKIAQFVENLTGEIATPTPAGPMQGAKAMSMRHCAVAAGLGEFGWHSIVLTPEFGPRNRFGAVLTTAELEPDPMYSGPKLCDPSKCRICVEMCPTKAISAYSPEIARYVKIGENEYSYGQTNWNRCRVACHGLLKGAAADEDLFDPQNTNPIDADLLPAMRHFAIDPCSDSPQHSPTWKCGNCLSYCPVGNWKERFLDKGLTKADTSIFMDKEI